MTSHGDLKTINRNAMLTPTSFLSMQEDFHWEDGQFSDLDQKRKVVFYSRIQTTRRMMMIKFGESGHPVFRATSPLSRGTLKSKGVGKLSLHFCAPDQEDLLQKYQERVERLSQQNRVIEICMDAGFLTSVEVGQYFMTKDTEEFSQFTESVACREYTLPRDEKSSDPKGWIRGNIKIGPVLEVTTCCLQGKYGVEIRIESANKDNSHSWVRISHGMNKLDHGLEQQGARRQRAGNL